MGGKIMIFKYVLKCQVSLPSSRLILLSSHGISSGYIELDATGRGPECLSQ